MGPTGVRRLDFAMFHRLLFERFLALLCSPLNSSPGSERLPRHYGQFCAVTHKQNPKLPGQFVRLSPLGRYPNRSGCRMQNHPLRNAYLSILDCVLAARVSSSTLRRFWPDFAVLSPMQSPCEWLQRQTTVRRFRTCPRITLYFYALLTIVAITPNCDRPPSMGFNHFFDRIHRKPNGASPNPAPPVRLELLRMTQGS